MSTTPVTIPFAPGLQIGDKVQFRKTIGESDVYLYAGITGDFAPHHIDEQFMQGTRYGRRIAHGSLLIGFSSTASTLMANRTEAISVSAGYDRIRFVAPVFIGDTVTTDYELTEADESRKRTFAACQMTNQDGVVCAVAVHILQFID